jgi:indole-3-glycerol phosphate synthase
MAAVLESIVAEARRRAAVVAERGAAWVREAQAAPPARDLGAALGTPGLSVIAEVKRRSPSAGDIAPSLDPAGLAGEYAAGGAAALSVLTEPTFFGGSEEDLRAVRNTVELPVLRKDFIVDPVQVWESRAIGADAVLLIVAVLEDAMLRDALAAAAEAGVAALVEVHDEAEVERALGCGARLVGVNNRDLKTFDVDVSRAERMRVLLPAGVVTVAESGVTSREGAARMAAAGYDAVLVGEAAVRAGNRVSFIRQIGGVA